MVTRLCMNFKKTEAMETRIQQEERVNHATTLGCNIGNFPSKYLALQLSFGGIKLKEWSELV